MVVKKKRITSDPVGRKKKVMMMAITMTTMMIMTMKCYF